MAERSEQGSCSRRAFVSGATGAGIGAIAGTVSAGLLPQTALASSSSPVSDSALNVASFGILGDGITDQSKPLRMLLERVVAEGGGSLLFPPGTYRIREAITIPRNVTIVVPRGALFENDGAISIEGTLSAGLYQIFLGSHVRFGAASLQWSFPQWWGAQGNGIHDDSEALQAALQTRRVFLPAGKYRTTRELVLNNRTTLVGVGNSWNPVATTDSWIQYDGPADERVSVLRASVDPVGVEPSAALSSIHVEKIVLNGGNAAGYGLYSAYCTDDSSFVDLTVRHCLQHGLFVATQWYSNYRNIVARDNPGCGITIGASFEGWRQTGVNGVVFSNIRAANNGRDGQFDEKSNLVWGYGVFFRPNAGTDIHHFVSENNYGPGLIFDLGSGCANRITGGYLEANGRRALASGAATRAWGLVVVGHSNARANAVESVYFHGTVGENGAQSIWLTGREPTGDLTLRDLSYGHHIRADWSRYCLEGHVYWGLRNYITGHIPNSPTVVSAGLDTLYAAEDGSDAADGRTPEGAFRTLGKAILAARYAVGVRTIVYRGAARDDAVLDFVNFPLDRELTIVGDGAARIGGDRDNESAMHVRHALNKITIIGFERIQGLHISACRDLTVSHTGISSATGQTAAIVDGNSSVAFVGCSTGTGPDRQVLLDEQNVRCAPGSLVRVVPEDA
jgi:hypothetical protein